MVSTLLWLWQTMIEIIAERYCGCHPKTINDGSLVIGRITYLVTCIDALMVVCILGSTMSHCVTSGKMRLLERAMGGSPISRGSVMLGTM